MSVAQMTTDFTTVKRYLDSAETKEQATTAHRARYYFNRKHFGRDITAMTLSDACTELLNAAGKMYRRVLTPDEMTAHVNRFKASPVYITPPHQLGRAKRVQTK